MHVKSLRNRTDALYSLVLMDGSENHGSLFTIHGKSAREHGENESSKKNYPVNMSSHADCSCCQNILEYALTVGKAQPFEYTERSQMGCCRCPDNCMILPSGLDLSKIPSKRVEKNSRQNRHPWNMKLTPLGPWPEMSWIASFESTTIHWSLCAFGR